MRKRTVRQRAIDRLRSRLIHRGAPRLEMGLIVAAAASIGLVSSMGMLWLGLHAMWLRYALAASVGYCFFLALVWLWLPAGRGRLADWADLPDASDIGDLGDLVMDAIPSRTSHAAPGLPAEAPVQSGDVGGLDVDLGLDELLAVVAVVAAIVAGLLAAGYVVITAPSFFAEVLVDGAISYGLYRRVHGLEQHHWIRSALSRTWLPFAAVVAFLVLAGAAMQRYAPAADSIGDVWLRPR